MGVNGIYGLSGSGLDIESMVKVGMLSKQSQYDKMQQQYTKNEWIKEAYVDMYGKVQTFNNSTLSQYKMSSNMNARLAESSDSSVKVTANANAAAMNHYVEVTNSATNAYLIGENSITRKGDSQTSTVLADALYSSVRKNGAGNLVYYKDSDGNNQQAKSTDVAFKFSIGDGVSGGLNVSNSDVLSAGVSASAKSGSYKVNVTQLATAAEMTGSAASMTRYDSDGNAVSGSTSSQLKDLLFKNLTIEGGKVKSYETVAGFSNSNTDFTGAAKAVSFTLGDGSDTSVISVTYNQINNGFTLGDLADKINDAGLNITASYDSDTQEFSLVNSKTGSSNEISFTLDYNNNGTGYAGHTTAALLNGLQLGSFAYNSTTSVAGQDAELTINGNSVTSETNEFTRNGINYNLKATGESTVKVDTAAMKKTTISITYGQLADGYTFNDLTAAINTLGTNVRASYDSVNDKFSFYNSESGSTNGVSLTMADSSDGGKAATEFFNALGLKQSSGGKLADDALTFTAGKNTSVYGTNASVKVDGMSYDISDNKLTVNGVTYNFTGATAGTTSTVTVTHDTDSIIDKVKSFIDDYNNLLKTLTDAYNEKPNSNYKPLTDSQRDQMKDEQIEKWEEKARAGLLYHDKTLGKLISEMREAVSTPVEGIAGKYNSIFALGISTTGTKGQLTLDEDKLKAALTDDPDSVYNVFAKLDSNDMDNASKSGIAQRLGDVFTNNMKSIRSRSGTDLTNSDDSDLSKLLRELQTKMSNFKSMMNAFEDKLYKKYDSMETALARLGTQLNYVSSAFS